MTARNDGRVEAAARALLGVSDDVWELWEPNLKGGALTDAEAALAAADAVMFSDEAVERVRRVLAKGAYQMAPDELPYAAQARAVIAALKEGDQ